MQKARSFVSAAALAFALLSFGPAVPAASAWNGGSRGGFHGRFASHGGFGFHGHDGRFFRGHDRFFPGHGRFFHRQFPFRSFHRPFRLVRVFVSFPFPHWVSRRVFFAAPVDPFCGY